VKGTVGIGLPTVAVAILSTGMELRMAIALMAIPAVTTNVYQASRGDAFAELLRRHWPLVTGCFIGTWIGSAILFAVDQVLLSGVLGMLLCLYSAWALATPPLFVRREQEAVLGPLTGVTTGVMTGCTGSLSLPLMAYLDGLRLPKDRFVQLAGIVATALTAPLAIGVTARLAREGALGVGVEALLVLAPSFIGLWAGQWLRDRLSERRFRLVVLAVLFALGVNLVQRAFL
jgi:uncharacterized protein